MFYRPINIEHKQIPKRFKNTIMTVSQTRIVDKHVGAKYDIFVISLPVK